MIGKNFCLFFPPLLPLPLFSPCLPFFTRHFWIDRLLALANYIRQLCQVLMTGGELVLLLLHIPITIKVMMSLWVAKNMRGSN
ncbi:hypothetical protein ANA_C11728 [Anabaena sp. 90]|jgi:hypothetical protein|nr:hypothetical protein ANA_C11728 [Anabaena sp. 90]